METDIEIIKHSFLALDPEYSDHEWNYIKRGLSLQTFKAKEFFIKPNKKKDELGFITSGLVRAYYLDAANKDHTFEFIKEFEYVSDYPALLMNTYSRYYFQCLEPTTMIIMNYPHLKKGYEHYPRIDKQGRLVAEEVIKQKQRRIESFQFEQGEERYTNFLRDNSDLFKRITLTHLSSYLGIERPSLSRIRKKIAGL